MKNQIIKDLKMHHSVQFEKICKPLCKHQNEREPDVLDGNTLFLCLIEDVRFDQYWQLRVMKPYIAEMNEPSLPQYGFGWARGDGQYVCSNKHQPVTDFKNDPYVIAFKEIK